MLHTFGFSGDGRLGISKNAKGGRTRRLSVEARHTQLRGGAKPVTKTPVGRKVAEDEVAAPTPVFVLTRDGLDHGNVTIASVACGSIHSGCITEEGFLYMWGRGKDGRLGNESGENQTIPCRVQAPLQTVKVQAVAAGVRHTVAISSDGMCYTWGKGKSYQLGTGDTKSRMVPTLVQEGIIKEAGPLVRCAAGGGHTSVVTAGGEVFSWGLNSSGQCGTGTPKMCIDAVKALGLTGKRAVQIVAGTSHTLVRTADGQCYGCGDNSHGQLGVAREDLDARPQFQRTKDLEHIVDISTEAKATLACTEDGSVYAWGADRWDLEHLNAPTGPATVPVRLSGQAPFDQRIIRVATGGQLSMVLTESGQVWKWDPIDGVRQVSIVGAGEAINAGPRHAAVIVSMKHDTSRGAKASDDEHK